MVELYPIWDSEEKRKFGGKMRVWKHVKGAEGRVERLCKELRANGWEHRVRVVQVDYDKDVRGKLRKEAVKRGTEFNPETVTGDEYQGSVSGKLRGVMSVQAYVVEWWKE